MDRLGNLISQLSFTQLFLLSVRFFLGLTLLFVCGTICSLYLVIASSWQASMNTDFVATGEALINNPPPLPEFIRAVHLLDYDNRLCLLVWQGALWQEGDDADRLQQMIVSRSKLQINGKISVGGDISIPAMFPRDKDGNVTEKFGADIEFCYQLDLKPGFYTATFETQALANETVSYTWGLKIGTALSGD